jgi:hypothetical protein
MDCTAQDEDAAMWSVLCQPRLSGGCWLFVPLAGHELLACAQGQGGVFLPKGMHKG